MSRPGTEAEERHGAHPDAEERSEQVVRPAEARRRAKAEAKKRASRERQARLAEAKEQRRTRTQSRQPTQSEAGGGSDLEEPSDSNDSGELAGMAAVEEPAPVEPSQAATVTTVTTVDEVDENDDGNWLFDWGKGPTATAADVDESPWFSGQDLSDQSHLGARGPLTTPVTRPETKTKEKAFRRSRSQRPTSKGELQRRPVPRLRVAASLIVFVLGGLVAWRIWPDPARVTVEPGAAGAGETLVVASGTIDLAGLDRAAAAIGRPDAVQPGADGTYLLSQPVMIGPGGSLVLDDVELRLLSSPERFVGVEARDGDLHLRQSTVTSWDPVTEGADTDVSDGRAYVLARDGARMDVSGSTVAMLGYDAFERYGISWRTAGTDGVIDTSTFRGNFYGAYMNGVEPMEITDSVVEGSVSYGLDPHSASRDFTISGNTFRNNGKHGMILAEDATGAVVTDNQAYGNAEHGIVVFGGSDGAVVEGNRAHDNGIAGISVNGSAGVVMRDNDVWANVTGIAIQDDATSTLIDGNRVSGNRQDGILVTSERATATVTNNRLDHNSRAGIWVSDGQATIGPGNRIADNESGVRLVDETASVEVVDNIVTENYKDGVSLVVSAGLRISGNQIVDNEAAFSVRTPGDAGPFLDGNELRDNEVGAERVREPDPVDPGDPVDPVAPVG